MPFDFDIKIIDKSTLPIALERGDVLVVLGANGTGKSSLMHDFYCRHKAYSRRITAHRQTWFTPGSIGLSPEQKIEVEDRIRSDDTDITARWREQFPEHRAYITIQQLLETENSRAHEVANAAEANDPGKLAEARSRPSPIRTINDLFRSANLAVEIRLDRSTNIIATRNGTTYGIAELSDGERSALLLSISVLTADPGTIFLIDEPERHLHRAIVFPLLSQLFFKRLDCIFVISTHELRFAIDIPKAKIVHLRNCHFDNNRAEYWDAVPLDSSAQINDEIKTHILGSRKKLLFVEGVESSLDRTLYAAVFPEISVVPQNNCKEVEQSVVGIRESSTLHWLKAFGLIDGDGRSPENVRSLATKGVFILPVYAIESLYYHPTIQRKIAIIQARIQGAKANELIEAAAQFTIDAVKDHTERLAIKTAQRKIRDTLFANLPTYESVNSRRPVKIDIDVEAVVQDQIDQLASAVEAGNTEDLICKYPIRTTPALDRIAQSLLFRNRIDYENAVRTLLYEDSEVREFIRSHFKDLLDAIAAESDL